MKKTIEKNNGPSLSGILKALAVVVWVCALGAVGLGLMNSSASGFWSAGVLALAGTAAWWMGAVLDLLARIAKAADEQTRMAAIAYSRGQQ